MFKAIFLPSVQVAPSSAKIKFAKGILDRIVISARGYNPISGEAIAVTPEQYETVESVRLYKQIQKDIQRVQRSNH